jgi:hypothetical protein
VNPLPSILGIWIGTTQERHSRQLTRLESKADGLNAEVKVLATGLEETRIGVKLIGEQLTLALRSQGLL